MEPRTNIDKPRKEFEEKRVSIGRVSRSVAGGRRMRSRVVIVLGDKNGRVGFGIGKGNDVALASAKATNAAKKNMVKISIVNDTIRHEVEAKYAGAHVLLKPAGKGTSIIAGGPVRAVVELAGIKNILSKSLGSSNPTNIVAATIAALLQLPKIKTTPKDQDESK